MLSLMLSAVTGCATAPGSDHWPGHPVDEQAYWMARMEIDASTDGTRSLESRREIFERFERTEDPAVVLAMVDSLEDLRICDPEASSFSSEMPGQTHPCSVRSRCHEVLQELFGFFDLNQKPGGPDKPWREWLDDRSGKSIAEIYDEVTACARWWTGTPPAKSGRSSR